MVGKSTLHRSLSTMYRVFLLVTFAAVLILGDDSEEQKKCSRIITHPAVKFCCKKGIRHHGKLHGFHRRTHTDDLNLKECFHSSKKLDPCERELCIANKKGFASADGEIDKDALAMVIENDFEENNELKELILDNCVGTDLTKFGPEDMCDVMKLKMCMDTQHLKGCEEWDDEAPCEGMQKLVEDCMQLSE
ncbi:uncharacterized protein LOC113509323 [Galleria mellonella]|uniref:Uncharacterized protein LOC113509323 n=1 Tax=Galleria mellonella TaxID=7137 RepID=A0A6J1W6Z2_GALME|nr:uncharacterized protein LOC113509323 [Galleria mellonella]